MTQTHEERMNRRGVRIAWWLRAISRPWLSRTWGRLVRIRRPRWLSRLMIRIFAAKYGIDMGTYEGEQKDYACLSDFFIRRLDASVRPIPLQEDALISPADGRLLDVWCGNDDDVMVVKGHTYSLRDLLGGRVPDPGDGPWHVATIYLSPADYHRFHYPGSAVLEEAIHLGGRLFPVNATGLARVPGLFTRNERVVTGYSEGGVRYWVVAVGATNVGRIPMEDCDFPGQEVWIEPQTPVRQGAEMGRFELGSTLVMVLPSRYYECVARAGVIRVGDPLFRRRLPS